MLVFNSQEDFKDWIKENNTGVPLPLIDPVPLNANLPSTDFIKSQTLSKNTLTTNRISLNEVEISNVEDTSAVSNKDGSNEAVTPEEVYDVPGGRRSFPGDVEVDAEDPVYDAPNDRTGTLDSELSVGTSDQNSIVSEDIYDVPKPATTLEDTPKPLLDNISNAPRPKRQVPPLPTESTTSLSQALTPPLPQRKPQNQEGAVVNKALTLPPPRRAVSQPMPTPPLPPRNNLRYFRIMCFSEFLCHFNITSEINLRTATLYFSQ